MLALALYLLTHLLPGVEEAALTACNEAGIEYLEGQYVLQVAVNRSKHRKLTLQHVLSEKGQFNLKKCDITPGHLFLGIIAYFNLLNSPKLINTTKVRYYDALWSQERNSSKCPGFTVGQMWEYAGLLPVCKSSINHIFFHQVGNNPGCPSKEWKPRSLYRKRLPKCQ